MKRLSELITKTKIKIGVLLLCFMVLIIACIYYANNNKQIATIDTPKEEMLKAQLDIAPEGYTEITTKEQLAAIKDNLSGKYILMADLDMTDVSYEIIGPTSSTPFSGTFDGNYHKISNLKIESENQFVGMFGYISGGTIKNLLLENVNVKGASNVGALAGNNYNGTIINVGVTGEVIGTNNYVGGVLGNNSGTVTNAYSTATVSGNTYVGGLIGYARGTITNTYAVGKVTTTGTSNVGGLTGYKSGTVNNSYWAIDVTGQITSPTGEGRFISVMLKPSTFKTWDFETIWQIEEGETLPYLKGMTKPETVKKENYTYTEWEGEGTSTSPYLIKTPQNLREIEYALGAYYQLANDIDMTNEEFTGIVGQFNGTFDGNHHKISNLKIDSTNEYVGMFTYLNKGTITNLTLENINITNTDSSRTGGLVGYNSAGTINNVYVTGQVTGTSNVGGLVGLNWGTGTITNSCTTVTVTGTSSLGGLVGENRGKITNAYATGAVTGKSYVGGLVGFNFFGTINNAYVTGQVIGESYVGGLIGSQANGTTTNSYWATDTTKQLVSAGGDGIAGKFFNSMLRQETFKNWTFGTIWQIEEGNTLPYLIGMAKPETVKKENYTYTEWEGEGTSTNPYLIKTPQQLREVDKLPSAYYQLENDIDMTNEKFEPIIKFTGTFDGLGHKITNLTIKSENQYVGMFGNNIGTIKNLGLENVDITNVKADSDSNTGGLVGYNNGVITNTYVTGQVTGTSNVGGLAGYNIGTITNAYSTVKVTGDTYVGGLVGRNYKSGSISNTYSIGKVTSIRSSGVGGLIGYNSGKVSNSYWSLDTSNQEKSDIGEGKTTYELLQQSTYQNWAFDTIWEIEEGHTLAYLKEMKGQEIIYIDFEGEGTVENPYLIRTIEELQEIQYVPSAYYQLANEIDASEIKDFKLNMGNFKGVLDGKNYSINNLTIKSNNDSIGLFEQNSGTIKNLKLNNVNIESNYNGDTLYIGGICANNNGTIKNVEVNGTIKNIGTVANLHMGQIAGYNIGTITKTHSNGILTNEGRVNNGYIGGITGHNYGEITISYNTGNIIINNIENLKIGGIAGKSSKVLKDSYSKGNININAETATIGGIVGEATGFVTKTYSVDKIEKVVQTATIGGIVGTNKNATIISSYWNIPNIIEETGKGTLKTIEELKQQATFENWDFDNIWNIEENTNTPTFQEIFNNDIDYYENEYETDDFWEWHTRTTTDDQAYNGKHIIINKGHSINFYGYGITSYKDYLYKYYKNAGEKTFMFKIDETKASYHTLDGAGFIFNASKENNLLSGYVLLIRQSDICIYRLDNVNAETFEIGSNATVQTYAGQPIASIAKTSSTTHNLIVKTSPTNVTVIDNEEEILNVPLDYSKHAGEDFGLLASYAQHNCSILSEIQFLEFLMEVKDYTIPVLKTDENGKRLANAKFQVKNEAGEVIREGSTDSKGIYNIKGLQEGIYTLEEIEAPARYALKNNTITFKVTNEGKAIDINTEEEIEIKVINEKLKFVVKVEDTNGNPIPNSKVNLYDEEGNVVLDSDGQPIVVTTTSDGTATITDIEAGKYTFKQTNTPSDYILNDTIYTVEVTKDGTVTFKEDENGTIVNKKYGNVIIRKYEEGTTKGIKGAVIEIKDASENTVRLTTNEDGIITFKTFPGTYSYKEITAPNGYILNNTEYTFTVTDNGTVKYDSANGIIYNSKEILVMKDPLTIIKYRTNTTIGLAGATIAVFDADGNKIAEQVTGENGTVTFTGLEVGSYYYKEIEAPAGYVLNNTEYHFTVKNDGSVTLATGTTKVIYNDRVTMAEKDSFNVYKYRINSTTPLAGAVIAVFDEDGNKLREETTNAEGQVTFSGLEVGTYYYQEIEPPVGYILNDTKFRFTVNNDGSVDFSSNESRFIWNNPVIMEEAITITKKKTGTDTPVPGAVIGIFDIKGNKIKEGTTNEYGAISFNGLEFGEYYYKEIEAPAGYVLNNTEYHFTVETNGKITLGKGTTKVIYNNRVTMNEGLTITKYRTNTTIGLPGATIAVFDANGNKVAEQVTGENGTVTFTGLEVGSYYYKEIEAPAGYVLNNTEYHFTVENDGIVTLAEGTTKVIYNNRVTMNEGLTITKYRTNTTIGLPGATIAVFDANGNKVAEQVTGENGTVTFTGLEVGSYYYKEIEAPAGYVLNNTEYHFTVENDGTVKAIGETNFIIYNNRVTMNEGLTITKYKTNTTIGLPGATIAVFDADGNKISEQVTGENGTVTFTGLEVGSYYYKEIEAPAGYLLNNTEYHFTVENDGSVILATGTTKVIYNDRISKDHIIITKYVTDTTTPVAGAVIGLFDTNGNKLLEQTTNEKGQVDFTDLEPGTYKYKELTAPNGYVLNETMYTFTIEEDGTVMFDSANGIIYNSRVTMKEDLIIVKYKTGTNTPLAGAVIGIFDETGKEIVRQTTNEVGQVIFTGIEVGNYYYKEISAPTGYVLNNTEYHFTVENDGSVILATGTTKVIYNDRISKDHVIITKYVTDTTTPVAGAVIGLFDTNGNKLLEQTTNEKGQVDFVDLEPGTYKYKELIAPNGYILNEGTYTFTIAEDGTVTFDSANGIIYNKKKEDKPVNPDVYGDITLVKYEEGTTIRIEGAIIGIYDANGNAIKNADGNVIQFITNEFGEIKFKIKPGTYQYKELVAPEGYELNNTIYTFTVAKDGTVTFDSANGIIYNKKKEEKPDVPDVYGEVIITKYQEGTKIALKGATIGIYDSEKNEVKAITNENGTISFKAKPGVYQYQELVAPDGYELNNTIYTFTVTEKGEVIFDKDTKGIIYDKKKEDKPDIPDVPDVPDNPDIPDKPDVPNKPDTPENPKGNVIIPGENTIVKEPTENIVSGKLPQTGETEGIIVITIVLVIVGIYFGIKIRDKQ